MASSLYGVERRSYSRDLAIEHEVGSTIHLLAELLPWISGVAGFMAVGRARFSEKLLASLIGVVVGSGAKKGIQARYRKYQ